MRIRDWKGILGDEDRRTKLTTLFALTLVSASMTFTQLGFIGLGANGVYFCYVMGLLAPVAVAALLLGKGLGFVQGLLSGAILGLHAYFQPLDIIERFFVTPLNSVVLYPLVGFLLGLLFAVALRNKPAPGHQIFRVALVCLVVSFIASIAFLVNSLIAIAMQSVHDAIQAGGVAVANDNGAAIVSRDLLAALVGIGNLELQVVFDALLMFVMVVVSTASVWNLRRQSNGGRIKLQFRSRLLLVLVLVFMAVSAVGFTAITIQSEKAESDYLSDELGYLSKLVGERVDAAAKVSAIPEFPSLSNESRDVVTQSADLAPAFSGFSLEDGTVAFVVDDRVVYSNSPAYPVGDSLDQLFGPAGSEMVHNLAQDGSMRQILYDVHDMDELLDTSFDAGATSQIGYMKAASAGGGYILMALPSSIVFQTRYVTALWTSFTTLVLLAVVYVLAARLLSTIVVKPINKTNGSLAKITAGDLDVRVDACDSEEFASLSEGINDTVGALRGWIAEAETRMERELHTAKAIQSGALPRTFPPFPEIDKFDIFASMDPAKEVGGDFYDFFLIDEHTLGFLIADVAGKGVPGALFMMAAKTQIKNYMSTGMALDQAIASANLQLCDNNEAGMFVTVWAATLDYESGLLTYVNAGHNPPLLRHDGSWRWLSEKGGLFLATFDSAKYRQSQLTLVAGDELLLYTDGVNEAFSPTEEEYGNDRLESFLAAHTTLHPRDLVRHLRADVADWAAGAEQSDDVTILSLEYGVAPEVTGTLTMPAVIENLGRAREFVCDELDRRLCPASVKIKVEVALEELFVNVCRYAYADQDHPGDVTVSYVYTADPSAITIELVDQGVPFDPLSLTNPLKPDSVEDAKIGGLGIFMVKKSMDDFTYVYDGECNNVAIRKEW